jgi:hypothetical protein
MQSELFPLPKVFRITRKWRIFLLICPIISIIWGGGPLWAVIAELSEGKYVPFDIILALLSLGMASLLLWGYFDYSKSRLVLTLDGITYYGSGFRVYTPWQNAEELGNGSQRVPMSVSWTPQLIGFKLRENAIVGMKVEDGRRQGRAAIETDWWYPAVMRARYASFFIIDEIFRERHWQQGELGAYLHHSAPQMFEWKTTEK